MKHVLNLLILALSLVTLGQCYANSDNTPEALKSKSDCEKNEEWSGQGSLPKSVVEFLSNVVSGNTTPALGIARAYDLEKSTSTEARLLGYYMEARAMLMSGQEDSALESFAFVATSEATNATGNEIKAASLQCIAHTLRVNSGLAIPSSIISHLKSLNEMITTSFRKQIAAELAFAVVLDRIAQGASESELRDALEALSGSGFFEKFARGYIAAQHRDYPQVIANLAPILTTKHLSLPDALKLEETRARLTLARAYYANRQFNDAITQYQKIDHRSNEIAETLSELSWSYLQLKRYGEAVGTAVTLRLGEMKETFAPDSLVVAAMSLNELCQFQDSLRTVKTLEHDYLTSYEWLKVRAASSSGPSLYTLAIEYIKPHDKGSSSVVPSKVANEWVRAPLFLAGQSEIHRLFGVKERYGELLNSMKEESSSASSENQESLRQALLTLQQRQSATLEAADRVRTQWVDRINAELASRSARMLTELDDVRENSRMIKIEIFNGASHDMIWLRAHPQFKAGDTKYLSEKDAPSGSNVWNWGKVDLNADHAELWEDELGSFRAHLQDHCGDKDRYLSIKTANR